MLPIRFPKQKGITLETFITHLKKGERNFFKLLDTPEKNFIDASFKELMSNESDIVSGVNRVQKNFRDIYFDLFESCLVKHHDNGEVKFVFFTTTRKLEAILMIAKILFDQFGIGIYDDGKHRSFTDVNKLSALSKGFFINEKDDHVQLWRFENLNILLQYRTSPLQQLSLMITIKPAKNQDRTIRRRGTIFDQLQFNIFEILNRSERSKVTGYDGEMVKYVDYTYDLPILEFGIFNKIVVRIFNESKHFDKDIQTHVTLFSSTPRQLLDKIQSVETLVKIYGEDDSGNTDIEFHERDIIESNEFWTGRTWNFNESHGIWDLKNKEEKFAYSVSVSDFEDELGFNLSILGFNNLVTLFTTD